MNTNTTHQIIFSVDRLEDTEETLATKRDFALNQMLNYSMLFQVVKGVYKGKSEQSYLVRLPAFNTPEYHATIARLIGLARGSKQESILYIHNDQHSELWVLDNQSVISLGKFTEVTQAEALKHDAYTVIGDKHYIAI